MIHLQLLLQFLLTYPGTILGCVLASFVLGFLWYGPIFGAVWVRLTGLASVSDDQKKAGMPFALGVSALSALCQSVVLGRAFQILLLENILHPLIIVLIIWLPFTALVFAQNNAYNLRPFRLTLIDAGYTLVNFWVMAIILYTMVSRA
jgi:Protein of unknown function (DUF1761)